MVDGRNEAYDGSYEGGRLQVAAEYGVADVGDNALHCLGVLDG